MAKNNRNSALQKNPRKNPGGTPISIVHTSLEVMPFHRTTQDMDSWRSALRQAESLIPNRSKLYNLYADVELDPHVEAVTSKIRDAVTDANWHFVDKDGKPVDAINQLIDSIGFQDLLEEIVNAKFWGYSMLEPQFYKDHRGRWQMSTYCVPRKHMRPELGIIAHSEYGDDGLNIREGIYTKTIMEVGKPKDLGLHLKAAPFYILKRGGVGDWGMFVQVFGMPVVDAVWDGMDELQKKKLVEAVKELGSGGALVRPAGTTVTLLQNNNSANGELQESFVGMCDKQMSKGYLGTTETTEASSSSGYAQSKTHEGQDERKYASYIDFARKVLISRFIPILEAAGFDLTGGEFIIEGEEDELTKKEMFEIHKGLATEMKLPMDDDFLYETYGIPKPANYNELKKKQEEKEAMPAPALPPPGGNKRGVKAKPGEEEKLSFPALRKLVKLFDGFFHQAPESGAMTNGDRLTNDEGERLPDGIPLMEGAGGRCCGDTITLSLNNEPDITALVNAVKEANGSAYLYPQLFYLSADPLTQAFQKGWRAGQLSPLQGGTKGGSGVELVQLMEVGFEYGTDDPAMLTAWEMNLFKFSAVKAAYQSAEVNQLFRDAKNFAEFERMVRKLYGVKNKQHLITEYNTAYAVGESSATYYRLLAQVDIFPYWEYKTVGDDRVRPDHRLLHGRILPAGHPLWGKIWPPNDWQCRCFVVPRLAAEVDEAKVQADIAFIENYVATSPAWQKAAKNGFGINRASAMEVFTDQQMYHANPDGVMKEINQLTASSWKLLALAERQALAKKPFREDEQSPIANDYAGRTVSPSGAAWNGGSGEVVREPDEVWIADRQWTYVKYYSDKTVKVKAYLNDTGSLEVISSGTASEADRKGLLIKS